VLWLAVTSVCLVLFVVGIPVYFQYVRSQCIAAACPNAPPPPDGGFAALAAAGISPTFYAGYLTVLSSMYPVVSLAVAALLFQRKPDERMALFGAWMLVLFGMTDWSGIVNTLADVHPLWRLPVRVLTLLGWIAFTTFFYVFPDGRFVPRCTRWLALVLAAPLILLSFFPEIVYTWSLALYILFCVTWFTSLAAAQVYRYRHVSSQVHRQQTKWVVFGCAAAITGFALLVTVGNVWRTEHGTTPLLVLIGPTAINGCMLLIPLTIGVAALRSRLWDIDPIINRSLVYGMLTTCVIGIYVLVVTYLGTLFPSSGTLAVSLIGTGIVAVLFQPLRAYLQRLINHLMYGERDDPYTVLARPGRRVEETIAPGPMLQCIVETVAQALKLPYTAIAVQEHARPVVVAAYGTPVAEPVALPLTYGATMIGELHLAPRAPGEALSPADRRLLDDLARQVGVAVHAARLTLELEQSGKYLQLARERLVVAREEERRRLHHDLHDGLGPLLASMSLQLAAARMLVAHEPAAVDLLTDIKLQLQEAVADIRRLIYGLRPPALDELGLVPAIRAYAGRYGGQRTPAARDANGAASPLAIIVEASEQEERGLRTLPAAVEVAAYRIVSEALTNVVRHAHARRCVVRFSLCGAPHSGTRDERTSALQLEIVDDGGGISADARGGTGLTSMRDRAMELGGTLVVEATASGGTRVCAQIPLPTPGA
jgi:signal transduction histidine kinase